MRYVQGLRNLLELLYNGHIALRYWHHAYG